MNIDYNDQRFQQVNAEKQTALNNVTNTYNDMINKTDQYYNDLYNATENYGKQQQELQQQQTDFAIDQINQNKEWLKQDYTKEQKGAYQDYVNQTNRYGVNAEQMAQNGLLGTGYSESAKVSMYNAYQNRVATARDSYNRSVVDYDNQITQARLQNSATLAELAYNTLKTKLEYSLQGFQYKNDLIQTQLKMQNETEDRYYQRWSDVLKQINTEKAFEYQKERDRIADQQWEKQYALSKANQNNINSKIEKNGNEQYKILSTDNDGWGKTNLTQQIEGVGNVEVYRNPQGELLFWDPVNSGWVKYGGNVKAGGGSQALGGTTSGNQRSSFR